VLKIENLKLNLNGKSIINNLNLHVNEGEIHGVLGENGTGKTTIAYIIMGVNKYRADGGRILLNGQDISDLTVSQRARKGISLAWQEPTRIEGITVRDYLTLSGNNHGSDNIEECLQMVGMDPGRYLNRDIDITLSGGERKRIELASILVMQPKLAILDEPDSGIDIVALPIILDSIKAMNKKGTAVLLITHNEQMAAITDRVSVLCAGSILMTGLPEETCGWFKNNCQSCVHINEPQH